MELKKVNDLLNANYEALKEVKGHNKTTVKTCIALLEELPKDLMIGVRSNTTTPTNAGDIAEIWAGLELGFIDKNQVSINCEDLPRQRKNEIKLCYSNNRPSNDIEDKGHYMVSLENGTPLLTWVKRETVRAYKDLLIKGRRGGRTYAQAILGL
jgi:hypothetical protein